LEGATGLRAMGPQWLSDEGLVKCNMTKKVEE
jgi:hypothetical protein